MIMLSAAHDILKDQEQKDHVGSHNVIIYNNRKLFTENFNDQWKTLEMVTFGSGPFKNWAGKKNWQNWTNENLIVIIILKLSNQFYTRDFDNGTCTTRIHTWPPLSTPPSIQHYLYINFIIIFITCLY